MTDCLATDAVSPCPRKRKPDDQAALLFAPSKKLVRSLATINAQSIIKNLEPEFKATEAEQLELDTQPLEESVLYLKLVAKLSRLEHVFCALKYYVPEFSDRGETKQNYKDELRKGKETLQQLKACLLDAGLLHEGLSSDSEEDDTESVKDDQRYQVEIIDITNDDDDEFSA